MMCRSVIGLFCDHGSDSGFTWCSSSMSGLMIPESIIKESLLEAQNERWRAKSTDHNSLPMALNTMVPIRMGAPGVE